VQSWYGILFFIGVALLMAAWSWPPTLARSLPSDAIAGAAMFTPLFATWVMPNDRSLVLYPISVIALWFAATYIAPNFIPPPPPDAPYICGLGFLAAMILGFGGMALGVLGRIIGLSLRARLNSAVLSYLVQLIPVGSVVALILLAQR
jgi:hypothetical protein